MAHETTEPRTTLIVFFTVLSVATLALLQPIFNSYFDSLMGEEARVQQVENPRYYRGYQALRAEQTSSLSEGALPIERAMEAVAARRHELPAIEPEPSRDMQALAGWSFHPDYVAPPPVPAPTENTAPGPLVESEQAGPGQGESAPNQP